MANHLDTDVGSELFSSYEAELKLVQAELNQKLDQIAELTGEPRKAAVRQAERSLEESSDLVRYGLLCCCSSLDGSGVSLFRRRLLTPAHR